MIKEKFTGSIRREWRCIFMWFLSN